MPSLTLKRGGEPQKTGVPHPPFAILCVCLRGAGFWLLTMDDDDEMPLTKRQKKRLRDERRRRKKEAEAAAAAADGGGGGDDDNAAAQANEWRFERLLENEEDELELQLNEEQEKPAAGAGDAEDEQNEEENENEHEKLGEEEEADGARDGASPSRIDDAPRPTLLPQRRNWRFSWSERDNECSNPAKKSAVIYSIHYSCVTLQISGAFFSAKFVVLV